MKKLYHTLASALLLATSSVPVLAAGPPCAEDAKLMAQWSGQMEAAARSGDSCYQTEVLIKVLKATRAVLPKCAPNASALQHDRALLDQQIARAQESFAGHCNR